MADQNLRLAKYFTFGISFVLMALGGGVWPFIWWEMYSSGDYNPPTTAERIELYVRGRDGQQHILRPMDLYTVDDDSSRQAAGYQLVYRAVTGTDEQKEIYQPYLIRQVEYVLNTEIEQIDARQHFWTVDFDQHPPFNVNQPEKTVLLHSFSPDFINSVLLR